MNAAPSVALPGGRALLGWWRELAPLRPLRFWFAQLLLHRVEALVAAAHAYALDRFEQVLLRSLSLAGPVPSLLNGHVVDPQVLGQELRRLAGLGLLDAQEGVPGSGWRLTDAGRQALAEGRCVLRERQRRVFYFADAQPPRYLPLARPPSVPAAAPEGWHFDPGVLEACVRQPAPWKARHRFPADVEEVIGAAGDWRAVILDRPEQLALALVEVAGPTLLGLPVQPEGWVLGRDAPVLSLGEGWPEVLPELAEGPPAESWRQAWQAWCGPRGIPPAEVEACRLEASGQRLMVQAPARLVERLRAARSDAVKGEAWLLAGSGAVRAAALVELVEGG
jgi:hypothetical protein